VDVWQGSQIFCPARRDLDVTDRTGLMKMLDEIRPRTVLNLAAFTDVEGCEDQPDKAMLVNGEAVGWLAEGCARYGALLVQVSTDFVFDGASRTPYSEDAAPGPLSAYGRSKLRGEEEARRAPRHLIVRTSWLYDAWSRNFLRTMLARAASGQPIRVVNDQTGTPTSCRSLARQLRVAVEGDWQGLVHMTCGGETTWFGFAQEIFRQAGLEADLTTCATGVFPTKVKRPAYSVLSNERRKAMGPDLMPEWKAGLGEVLAAARKLEEGRP
jgi:dTDP-4-dehydrorhamnose reductase